MWHRTTSSVGIPAAISRWATSADLACIAEPMSSTPGLIELLISSWRSEILMPEDLPQAATELPMDGFDSPALRTLADIDL